MNQSQKDKIIALAKTCGFQVTADAGKTIQTSKTNKMQTNVLAN